MTINCSRCDSSNWHATGGILVSRRGLPRAVLVCDACAFRFTSGLKPALDAAAAERGDCELELPVEPAAPAFTVPQPSLPIEATRQSQGFVSAGELARRVRAADFKQRQTGGHE
jgi:hypothetical protein